METLIQLFFYVTKTNGDINGVAIAMYCAIFCSLASLVIEIYNKGK